MNIIPWRIHGAGIYANIDGIHVTIYSIMDPMGIYKSIIDSRMLNINYWVMASWLLAFTIILGR